PLAGFMAKYKLFALAAEGDYIWLMVLGIVGSMISIFFYFKPILASYFADGEPQHKIESSLNFKINIVLCAVLLIILGFLPQVIISLL
ncbi:MAG: hypothetical protein LWW85_07165, partial [Marinilabiliales bacterium]|nr:hypothetical protein [Marinilabiliales bacterium]